MLADQRWGPNIGTCQPVLLMSARSGFVRASTFSSHIGLTPLRYPTFVGKARDGKFYDHPEISIKNAFADFIMHAGLNGTVIAKYAAEVTQMKRLFTIILALVLLSVAAMPSLAQGRSRTYGSRSSYGNQARTSRAYDSRSYYDYRNSNRSFWNQHRDKLTVAGATVGGAVIGGLIGGKKGAIIGALAGGGGSALYTYKVRNNHRPFWR